ncbi:endolytic transglycosylase MltG (plasmid) [Pontibacillus sp. ALD_SL1]|uniref:endolytic transglycosylase MltG n=1 Tax=Pontibacillus sp. ALD_SL1 TaxID=2777185 RepID=UPI001A95B117|nr:endolytic transglycosylase MltG [Pontibacillus sp. ALD_SL1]QST02071.1 endolytic transglycosylase MltG [Pontibacillus sp. ALD_SL1]
MKKLYFFVSFLIILATSVFLFLPPYFEVDEGDVDIYHGASVKQIASLLEEFDIIKNKDIFYYYIRFRQLYEEKTKESAFPVDFKEGSYTIQSGDFHSLIDQLNEGSADTAPSFVVTIPEGSTITKIAKIISESGYVTEQEFLDYVNHPDTYHTLRDTYTWLPPLREEVILYPLEGYLQANTYYFPQTPSVEKIVRMMLEETDGWLERNASLINKTGFSFVEVLTLASVVEAESKFTRDRPKVAQVFLNRLKQGMKLESDMTAAYANGEHKVFMYNKDIKTNSPYNTYHTSGLPAGPINSPSSESFVSILKPEGEGFKALYFYAKPNGETFYADTFNQHEQNRKKYEHLWKELEKAAAP